MIFNIDQIKELSSVIDFFHTLFIGENVGMDSLSKSDLSVLKEAGISAKFIENTPAEQAYKFGILAAALKDKRVKDMTYDGFRKFINSGNFIPLTEAEKEAMKFVKQQMYNDIRGLGNRISSDFTRDLIESNKKQRLRTASIIRNETALAIRDRKTVNELASKLGHRTGDWSRDFDRISDYVMHSAYQHGVSSQLLNQYGEDVYVFFNVYESACQYCVATYLTDGAGSEPKTFKLVDVIENGSNIGRKAADYEPSVDPLHPFCRCSMNHYPENGVWDASKKQFVIKRNTYGVKRKSTIKVTIS
jgi:hypothetical protein